MIDEAKRLETNALKKEAKRQGQEVKKRLFFNIDHR